MSERENRSVPSYPKEWDLVSLRDVSDHITKGATPTTYGFEWQEEGIPFLRSECITENGVSWSEAMRISAQAHKVMSRSQIQSGDILISITGYIGRCCIYYHRFEGNINQHIARVRIRRIDIVNPQFVVYVLSSENQRHKYELIQTGQAYPQLSLEQIQDTAVPIPPLPEQRKIAKILTTVDKVIEKTKALIAKYQAIKQGMMHDLFTRGVDEHGQLRPPYEEAPELYKESELGWIPRDWAVCALESLLKNVEYPMRSGPFGSSLLKSEFVENGIPFLGIDNVYPEYFSSEFNRFVSSKKFQELRQYAVRERDVMITVMGTVGRCCIIPEGIGKALSSKHVWTMTFDESLYLPELICWQLNYASWILSEFERCSQGGVMAAISSTYVGT